MNGKAVEEKLDGTDRKENELKEQEGHSGKHRQQYSEAVEHVAEEAGHLYARLFGNGLHHEVGPVANVRHRSQEYGPEAHGRQSANIHTGHRGVARRQGLSCFKKHKIGGRIVQYAGERAGRPKESPWGTDPEAGPMFVQKRERRLHADEDSKEEGCYF